MRITASEVNAFAEAEYPSAHASGIRCESLGDNWAIGRWLFDGAHNRPGGLIAGPTQFTLADATFWFATFTVLGVRPMAVTAELSIRFLRPAQNADLMARAEILRQGRSGLVGEVRMWVDGDPDRLVSLAAGTYVDATPAK